MRAVGPAPSHGDGSGKNARYPQYAAQMMLGTAKMVLETNQHPGVLKDSVCSPAGSTIQGVRTLEERGMRAAVLDAVTVAYEKNVELKKASD